MQMVYTMTGYKNAPSLALERVIRLMCMILRILQMKDSFKGLVLSIINTFTSISTFSM